MRGVLQICFQGAVIQAAEGHGAALSMEREPAHEVDGSLECRHPIQRGVTGYAEGNPLVAAGHVAPERYAVAGAPLGGEHGLPGPVTPYEHAVVVFGVLVEQAHVDKIVDDAGGDTASPQIGAHSFVVAVGRGKDESRPPPLGRRPASLPGNGSRGIHGIAVERQQIADGLGERHSVEMLYECDGVAAGVFRVAEPDAPVFDPQAVHLPGGVVAADAPDLVAQGGQQVRQVRVVGGVDLRGREVPVRGASRVCDHLSFRQLAQAGDNVLQAASLTGAWMVLTPPRVQAEPHIP